MPSERHRRRRYSEEFKARVVAPCRRTGISVAAVALEHRLNANLLRRWINQTEGRLPKGLPGHPADLQPAAAPAFVPVALESGSQRGIDSSFFRGVIFDVKSVRETQYWPVV
ncbi:IS66-like element accessory protein TnpA [Paraburkholderia sp. MM5477-R1]|uniref:IS66-like element accessory protein TnpA n=1 Tax=Paraburkholderia sp. MM5477-R1 TaxID=2991062 RepID=UPI003D19C618